MHTTHTLGIALAHVHTHTMRDSDPIPHLRDRVLYLLQTGRARTHSELMLALPRHVLPYEVANALRDLRDRGLVVQTTQDGPRISRRGRAPKVWCVVVADRSANAGTAVLARRRHFVAS